jgi:hypothetical protein
MLKNIIHLSLKKQFCGAHAGEEKLVWFESQTTTVNKPKSRIANSYRILSSRPLTRYFFDDASVVSYLGWQNQFL